MHEDRLRELYAAFAARDIDGVLAGLADDVAWSNGREGGVLTGHDAVRDHWTRQWAQLDSRTEPVSFARRPDDRVEVTVNQRVLDLNGTLLGEGQVQHVYTFGDDGLVTAMEIVEGRTV